MQRRSKKPKIIYLKSSRSSKNALLDILNLVEAQIQNFKALEVGEFVSRKDGIELIPQKVVTESNLLQSIFYAVEETIGEASKGIVRKIHFFQWKIRCCEELGAQVLVTHMPLTETRDSVPIG